MKYLRQFLLILLITLIGELLKYLLPLPIPASIYGMAILFAGLMSGVIPLDAVKEAGRFLIEIMPVMFIPAGVGLMVSWGVKIITASGQHHYSCQLFNCGRCDRTHVTVADQKRKEKAG